MEMYVYEKIREDLKAGTKHRVLNLETNVTGEVEMCRHGYFNVKVGGGEEVWPSEKCQDIGPH